MSELKVGDLVEPIHGCLNHGFTGIVIEIYNQKACLVKFSSPKVTPSVQFRAIENLIKCNV